ATRASLLPNLTAHRYIIIVRTLSDQQYTEGGTAVSQDWNGTFSYEISLPKKAYPIGGCIKDMEIKLTPLIQQVCVHGIQVQLVEMITYRTQESKNSVSRTVATHKLEDCGEKHLLRMSLDNIRENTGHSTSPSTVDSQRSIEGRRLNGLSSSSQGHHEMVDQDDEILDKFYHKIFDFQIPQCSTPLHQT